MHDTSPLCNDIEVISCPSKNTIGKRGPDEARTRDLLRVKQT